MTQEIDELNRRFNALVVTAFKLCEKIPDCVIDDTDITFFNDLVDLASKHKAGEIDKERRDEQGSGLRTKYIEIKRARKRKRLEIKRSGQDYIKATSTLSQLVKGVETISYCEMFDLALIVIEVAVRLIREKLQKRKEGAAEPQTVKPQADKLTAEKKKKKARKFAAHLILEDETVYSVSKDEVKRYKKEYPDVDILDELYELQCMYNNHPEKRKTQTEISVTILERLKKGQRRKEKAKHSEESASKTAK